MELGHLGKGRKFWVHDDHFQVCVCACLGVRLGLGLAKD